MVFVALLRGINVGGNNKIKMAELKASLENADFADVKTYIQSGNIIFTSPEKDTIKLAQKIEEIIKREYSLNVTVLVINLTEYEKIIKNQPENWGQNPEWRYNTLFLLPGATPEEAIKQIGQIKPELETLEKGANILYQALSIQMYGKATTGKLASMPIYKKMTVRTGIPHRRSTNS